MVQANCRHVWVAESSCHDSFHLIYCRNCGVEMDRRTLLSYLNAAEALSNVVEQARANERIIQERLDREEEAEDGETV